MKHIHPLRRQRGVVLLFCLIVLVVLLAGGVAVVRSMNTSLFSAGNLAFRRDLLNQGEQAVPVAMGLFQGTGALANATTATRKDLNYSAMQLATNAQGIPTAIAGKDSDFSAAGVTTKDIEGATSDVTIRYVIDRLCSAEGVASSALCVQTVFVPTGGTASSSNPPAITSTVYRLTVRVSGPRDTQVFMQTTFTKPD